MKAGTVLVLAIVAALATVSIARSAEAKITPELEPVSDKKFFDGYHADYPTDERNDHPDAFRYPFPVIQADAQYDTDYVKDENSDNGHWAAQMKYDRVRGKLNKVKKAYMRAAEKAHVEEMEAAEAERKKEAADRAAVAAEDAARHARGEENEAQAAAKASKHPVADQEKVVEREIRELEECKRRLAEAKQRVEEVKAANAAKAASAAKAAKASQSGAVPEYDAAAHEASKKTVAEAQADYDKLEKELEVAAENLRKMREEQGKQWGLRKKGEAAPCPKGCQKVKSGAALPSVLMGLCLSAAVALWSTA